MENDNNEAPDWITSLLATRIYISLYTTVHMLYSLSGFEAAESKSMVDKKSMAKK